MKLRNKKTGEIRTAYVQVILENNHLENPEKPLEFHTQRSIAELNEEWEDAPEEPKEYWYIGDRGEIFPEIVENPGHIWHQARKEIGNYFETKEEAERAVEKLRAWKRLKDKSFKLIDYSCPLRELYFEVDGGKFFEASGEVSEETRADLTLLFGGEE